MKGQRIGYIRVSDADQNVDRQLQNIHLDKKFIDKYSGKSLDRPQFQAMMEYIREGDTLIVHSLDRLARNLHDLRVIVEKLVNKKIHVQFVKENLTFTGNDSPISMLTLSIMGAFAEFERCILRERQLEGIAIAKKKGKYKGRKKKLTEEQIKHIKHKVQERYCKSDIAKEFGISRSLLYYCLKEK